MERSPVRSGRTGIRFERDILVRRRDDDRVWALSNGRRPGTLGIGLPHSSMLFDESHRLLALTFRFEVDHSYSHRSPILSLRIPFSSFSIHKIQKSTSASQQFSDDRQLRSQWSKYRPPALPTQNQSGNYNPSNPYANNPPPPQNAAAYSYGNSQWENNNNVQAPPATYQPSMAGQYTGAGNGTGYKEVNAQGTGVTGMGSEHEHGYEWEQAREAERLEREQQQQGGGAPPPGYNVNGEFGGGGVILHFGALLLANSCNGLLPAIGDLGIWVPIHRRNMIRPRPKQTQIQTHVIPHHLRTSNSLANHLSTVESWHCDLRTNH